MNRDYVSKAVALKGRAPLAVIDAIKKVHESLQGYTGDREPFILERDGEMISLSYEESQLLHDSLKAYLFGAGKTNKLLG